MERYYESRLIITRNVEPALRCIFSVLGVSVYCFKTFVKPDSALILLDAEDLLPVGEEEIAGGGHVCWDGGGQEQRGLVFF